MLRWWIVYPNPINLPHICPRDLSHGQARNIVLRHKACSLLPNQKAQWPQAPTPQIALSPLESPPPSLQQSPGPPAPGPTCLETGTVSSPQEHRLWHSWPMAPGPASWAHGSWAQRLRDRSPGAWSPAQLLEGRLRHGLVVASCGHSTLGVASKHLGARHLQGLRKG